MNGATFFGRLTRDVVVKAGRNGAEGAFFTLACDKRNSRRIEQMNQQDGKNRPTADFIPCSIFGYGANNGRPANNKRVDAIAQNVHKGDMFGVHGPIQTWQKKLDDGSYQDHFSCQIQEFQFCNNRNSQGSSNGGVNHGQSHVTNPFNKSNSSKPNAQKPSSAPQNQSTQTKASSKKPNLMKGSKKSNISDDDLPF